MTELFMEIWECINLDVSTKIQEIAREGIEKRMNKLKVTKLRWVAAANVQLWCET